MSSPHESTLPACCLLVCPPSRTDGADPAAGGAVGGPSSHRFRYCPLHTGTPFLTLHVPLVSPLSSQTEQTPLLAALCHHWDDSEGGDEECAAIVELLLGAGASISSMEPEVSGAAGGRIGGREGGAAGGDKERGRMQSGTGSSQMVTLGIAWEPLGRWHCLDRGPMGCLCEHVVTSETLPAALEVSGPRVWMHRGRGAASTCTAHTVSVPFLPPDSIFAPLYPAPQHGHAALEVAAREGRHGALRVLLSRGARANAVDKVGVGWGAGRGLEGRGEERKQYAKTWNGETTIGAPLSMSM